MIMKDDIYELMKYAELLSEGIDPTSGLYFQEDTILNNPKIRKYNKRVKELLDRFVLILDTGKKQTNKKLDFFLTKEMENRIVLSAEPVTISEFCCLINKVVPAGMKRLRASQITKELVDMDALKILESADYGEIKCPTEIGMELGIVSEERINAYGKKYRINRYSIKAQQYILENAIPKFDW